MSTPKSGAQRTPHDGQNLHVALMDSRHEAQSTGPLGVPMGVPIGVPMGESLGLSPADTDVVVNPLWPPSGPPMDPLWTPSGAPLPLWTPSGPPMDLWTPSEKVETRADTKEGFRTWVEWVEETRVKGAVFG